MNSHEIAETSKVTASNILRVFISGVVILVVRGDNRRLQVLFLDIMDTYYGCRGHPHQSSSPVYVTVYIHSTGSKYNIKIYIVYYQMA